MSDNNQSQTGSRTLVETPQETRQGELHLLAPDSARPRVRWEQGTVDNENMNKKKSKICCIFHPQRNFDEEEDHPHDCSSSESDSDSDTDSDEPSKGTQKRPSSPNAFEVQPSYSNSK